MTPPLFLVPELGTGELIELTGAEAHHAGTVKRLRVGEPVLLADGRGGLAEATVSALGKDRLTLTVQARRQVPQPAPRFVVVQALPKGERAELAVEVLTELGVDEIVPWSAARSISTWKLEQGGKAAQSGKAARAEKGVAKWQRTAVEAAKQSRRPWIPSVAELASTGQVADRISQADLAVVLDADADLPLTELAELARPGGRHAGADPASTAAPLTEVIVVVGPEGGITAEELASFGAAGARTVRLGEPVLRTSTAGAAALAVLSVALGRWR